MKGEQQILITPLACVAWCYSRNQDKAPHFHCIHSSWGDTDNHPIKFQTVVEFLLERGLFQTVANGSLEEVSSETRAEGKGTSLTVSRGM